MGVFLCITKFSYGSSSSVLLCEVYTNFFAYNFKDITYLDVEIIQPFNVQSIQNYIWNFCSSDALIHGVNNITKDL